MQQRLEQHLAASGGLDAAVNLGRRASSQEFFGMKVVVGHFLAGDLSEHGKNPRRCARED
jgi:hypothetical protein